VKGKVDRVLNDTEAGANLKAFAERTAGGLDGLKAKLNDLRDNSAIYMAIPPSVLRTKIVAGDGKFKNSLETGKGTFKTNAEARAPAEKAIFGIEADTKDVDEYPKYAFVASKDKMDHEGIVGWGYGESYVKFKTENIGNRTTITAGDSFDGNQRFKNYDHLYDNVVGNEIYFNDEVDPETGRKGRYRAVTERDVSNNIVGATAPAVPFSNPTPELLHPLVHRANNVFISDRPEHKDNPELNEANAPARKEKQLNQLSQNVASSKSLTDMHLNSYVEAQISGELTMKDVDSVYTGSVKEQKNLRKALDKAGYKDIQVHPSEYHAGVKEYASGGHDYWKNSTPQDVDRIGDNLLSKNGILRSFDSTPTPSELIQRRNVYGRDYQFKPQEPWLQDAIDKEKSKTLDIKEKREALRRLATVLIDNPESIYGVGDKRAKDFKKSLRNWTADVLNKKLLE